MYRSPNFAGLLAVRTRARILAALFVSILLAGAFAGPALGKARLIAVFPIKATTDLQPQAASVTAELIARLSAIDGYDAKSFPHTQHSAADDAAAAGATIYVSGQLLSSGEDLRLVVTAFDVATDHKLGSFDGVLTSGHIPKDFSPRAFISSPTSTAADAPPVATNLLLVPFQLPDNKDVALEFATTEFIKKMQSKGVSLAETSVMDHVEAATKASAFCKQYNVSGVIVGTARHEQRLNFMLGSYPTHAEVRASLIDCSGQTIWKGFGTGDIVYYWSNAGAAVSDAMGKALDTIVTQFFERSTTVGKP